MNNALEVVNINDECRFIRSDHTTLLATSSLQPELKGHEYELFSNYQTLCNKVSPNYQNTQATWLFPEAAITAKQRCDDVSINFINQYFLEQSALPVIAKHGFAVPKIYLASRDFILKEYIDGESVHEDRELLLKVIALRNDLLAHQMKNPQLFRNVMLDLFDECGQLRTNNIIASRSEKIYLIDLFVNR
jgi:hypothetical protein